jgi:hypothetical protein
MYDSCKQPHLHLGNEKIEYIYIDVGRLAALLFDDKGGIEEYTILEPHGD